MSETGVYTESTVIMTTVRLVAPFVFTYGLFIMFHGADTAGGGFQGGVVVAAAVLLLAFAYGIEPTRRWVTDRWVRVAIVAGIGTFLAIGFAAVLLGGPFLAYPAVFGDAGLIKYGIEAVELGIGAIVSGVLVALFFGLVRGDLRPQEGPR